LDRQIVPAVLPALRDELHVSSDAQAGRINTAFMLGYFLTAPFFGYLGDRASRKWLILIGIFVWCAGTVLTGFDITMVTLLVCRGCCWPRCCCPSANPRAARRTAKGRKKPISGISCACFGCRILTWLCGGT